MSIFGLFPVLVSCHYELSMFQLCLSRYVLITLCSSSSSSSRYLFVTYTIIPSTISSEMQGFV